MWVICSHFIWKIAIFAHEETLSFLSCLNVSPQCLPAIVPKASKYILNRVNNSNAFSIKVIPCEVHGARWKSEVHLFLFLCVCAFFFLLSFFFHPSFGCKYRMSFYKLLHQVYEYVDKNHHSWYVNSLRVE